MSYKDLGFTPLDDQCLADGSPIKKPFILYSMPERPAAGSDASHPTVLSEQIAQLSSYERDLWFLEEMSTGLASVSQDVFEEYYDPSQSIPSPELENALLYAGNETFEELQNHTRERITEMFSDIGVSDYEHHFPNIQKAMRIVEELMVTMPSRRTGEPSVSHIYRNILRMIEFIEGYNQLYGDRNESPIFTPEIVDFYICATAMHDFLEDYSMVSPVAYHRGGCREVRKSEFQQWDQGAHFYRMMADSPDATAGDIVTEITLDFGDHENDMFVSTLLALKSDNVEAGLMMEHLEGTVDALQDRYDQLIVQNQLYSLAAYVIKCCDRLDNNATYLYQRDKDGDVVATSPHRVYNKAIENMVMFDDMLDVLKLIAGHDKMTDEEIARSKPFYLKYDPTRWAKLVLAGVPLNTMYRPHEKGKGIAKIL